MTLEEANVLISELRPNKYVLFDYYVDTQLFNCNLMGGTPNNDGFVEDDWKPIMKVRVWKIVKPGERKDDLYVMSFGESGNKLGLDLLLKEAERFVQIKVEEQLTAELRIAKELGIKTLTLDGKYLKDISPSIIPEAEGTWNDIGVEYAKFMYEGYSLGDRVDNNTKVKNSLLNWLNENYNVPIKKTT